MIVLFPINTAPNDLRSLQETRIPGKLTQTRMEPDFVFFEEKFKQEKAATLGIDFSRIS